VQATLQNYEVEKEEKATGRLKHVINPRSLIMGAGRHV